ncbi:MAG TPA: DUF4864 domain-containing protein [Opitutaceae bacterium]|nr:DUF4864 domain-containing protein [Opitutaceae bacterium]
MKHWLAIALLGIAGGESAPLRAAEDGMQASRPEVKKEIVAVVEAQLAAFRQHDARAAYSYASTRLRAQKPLRIFTSIVQTNYPEIWDNARAEFGLAWDDGAAAKVLVHVFAKAGDASYDFMLVKERAGWRIEGVLRHEPAKAEKI